MQPHNITSNRIYALARAGCVLMLAAGAAHAIFGSLFRPEIFADMPGWEPRWATGYVVLAASYAWSELLARRGLTRMRIALMAAQTLALLYLIWIYPNFLVSSMIVVIAWQVAWATSLRNALAVAGAIGVALLILQMCGDGNRTMSMVILFSSWGFQIFAISAAHLARSEGEARASLASANAELTATQALLTESARMAERLRISRDLHDILGHNLTTLSIHLDVATRLTDGDASKHLAHAHGIAGELLGSVRNVVSQVRVQPIDLRAALTALADGLVGLHVRLDIPDNLSAIDAARADTLLRCVQELITNALRHSEARELVVELVQLTDGSVEIVARDDGCGGAFSEGGGLAGMRERFEALGGRLSFVSKLNEGFRTFGAIPPVGVQI